MWRQHPAPGAAPNGGIIPGGRGGNTPGIGANIPAGGNIPGGGIFKMGAGGRNPK